MKLDGPALRRNFRLRLRTMEAAVLSQGCTCQEIPGALRHAVELCRDQLHLPAHAVGDNARVLGGADATGVRVRDQGSHADYARAAAEECGRGYGDFPALDRSVAFGAAARPGALPVAAAFEIRCEAAGRFPGTTAARPSLCHRISA